MKHLTGLAAHLTSWLMSVADIIRQKLSEAFAPSELVVTDESGRHAGHAGARPEGESHFRVEIVSAAFEGLPRVARQRRVYEILAEDLRTDIHALALVTQTPGETRHR